jgi:hypothetical protein
MADIDDLVRAMIKGDPNETIDLTTITDMAESVLAAHWIPCPHSDTVTETNFDRSITHRWCQRCGAELIVKPENTDA